MATVSGIVSNYVVDSYIDDQGDYLRGPARITLTSSVSGVEFASIVRGGSIQWDQCGTWATWPRSKWAPGIEADTTFTASSTGVATRGATASADVVITNTITGNAIWDPGASASLQFTSSSTGNCTFSSTASSSVVFTASASGGKILAGVIDGDIVLTASATGERKPGGTATANISMTTDANGVVRLSADASAELVITATGQGNLTFFGQATAPIVFSGSIGGGLVVPPPNPNTTYVVDTETRDYVIPHDQVNDEAGTHMGHDYYKIPIRDGETRHFDVLFDTRETIIKSETREQPTEVF